MTQILTSIVDLIEFSIYIYIYRERERERGDFETS